MIKNIGHKGMLAPLWWRTNYHAKKPGSEQMIIQEELFIVRYQANVL